MNQHNLEIFNQSLLRVTSSPAFFDCFYDKFISQSDEISRFFKNRDMAQLKKKLRETLFMLAETAEGRPGLTLYIEMLGRIHKRLNVQRKHFKMWEEALLEAVKIYDDKYDDEVLAAWLYVIDEVIETMFSALEEARLMAS
ncbi:MAG: globin domain-containing protein [Candidatus Thiodiazotropha endolucinida]